jgi:hypothetical protein
MPTTPPFTASPPSRLPTATSTGEGHPPGAPVLSRGRSPSRALATLASHAMALRATLDCDLPRFTLAPIGWMARSEHTPTRPDADGLQFGLQFILSRSCLLA